MQLVGLIGGAFVCILLCAGELVAQDWPALPSVDGTVEIPAQEWPLRPGTRSVRILVHFPGGNISHVSADTGIMLSVAGKYLPVHGDQSLRRKGESDFDRRDSIRYPTSNGEFVISYDKGFPVGRFGTLAPDYPSFGEYPYDFRSDTSYSSGTMKAIWDNIRAVDLLATMPEVNPENIGCIGHSLGGHNAIFTAVFEPGLKVIVSSCGFTSMTEDDIRSWTGPRYMPTWLTGRMKGLFADRQSEPLIH